MTSTDFAAVNALNLPRVGQLGFVVHSIEASLPYYASFYNLHTWFEPKYAEKEFWIGSEQVEVNLHLTFAFSGQTQIELLEASGPGAALYQQYLAEHGAGLHHLGFYVNNLDKKLSLIKKLGLELLLEGRFKTAGGGLARFAYLETRQPCGIILELIEIRLYGLSIPQTPWMMNLATLTGDVLKSTR
jgi:hypothetical protein